MTQLGLVKLTPLMQRTIGRSEIVLALLDGPVLTSNPYLCEENIRELPRKILGGCSHRTSPACTHGTFVAGVLAAKRTSAAPAICPGCSLLVRPIFSEAADKGSPLPTATPSELAAAITEAIDAGARILNMSIGVLQTSSSDERQLTQALDYAAARGAIVVVAAGNEGTVGSSVLTRHAWAIPVVGCDLRGRPIRESNLSGRIGTRGLCAPGEDIVSLSTDGPARSLSGTSVATPFVSGAMALLWSEFPRANAYEIKIAITHAGGKRRRSVVPPLLDAWDAYHLLLITQKNRTTK